MSIFHPLTELHHPQLAKTKMEYVHISAQEAWKGETISHYQVTRPKYPVEVIQTLLNGQGHFQTRTQLIQTSLLRFWNWELEQENLHEVWYMN